MLSAVLCLALGSGARSPISRDVPRVPLDPPKGKEKMSIALPPGFEATQRVRGHVVFFRGSTQIICDWRTGTLTPPLLKAIAKAAQTYKKKGQVMGSLQLGRYSGALYRIPMNQGRLGLDLHAPLVSDSNLFSLTYYDPKADVKTTAAVVHLLVRLTKDSRFFPNG